MTVNSSFLGFLSTLISEALQFLQVKIEGLATFAVLSRSYIYNIEKIKNN